MIFQDPSNLRKSPFIKEKLSTIGIGEISTLCGRYWSMDRDNRWERIQKSYELLTNPNFPITNKSIDQILSESYESGITDEFLEPIRITDSFFEEGDGLIMFNFRPDRSRQLIKSLGIDNFNEFDRPFQPKLNILTFTQYEFVKLI